MSNPDFWNAAFAGETYRYGTEPNDFLASVAALIPAGPILCLGEGEGRNAVFLAAQGRKVTALDASETGLAKACRLAASRGVAIETIAADVEDLRLEPGAWAGIVSIWLHLPARLRAKVHQQVQIGLKPGGAFILEAYTPAQLAHGTGGPRDPELLVTAAALRAEGPDLDWQILRELERDIREGEGHQGVGAVVQALGFRRA